MLLNVSYCFK